MANYLAALGDGAGVVAELADDHAEGSGSRQGLPTRGIWQRAGLVGEAMGRGERSQDTHDGFYAIQPQPRQICTLNIAVRQNQGLGRVGAGVRVCETAAKSSIGARQHSPSEMARRGRALVMRFV